MTKKGTKAHRCPCCGRRTYRRPRTLTGEQDAAVCGLVVVVAAIVAQRFTTPTG